MVRIVEIIIFLLRIVLDRQLHSAEVIPRVKHKEGGLEGITFRKLNPSDFQRVAEFRKSFPSNPLVPVTEPEYYEWKFLNNPATEGFILGAEVKDK